MKLQLFLENKEVDLTGSETFPLNKTFNNLFNPTDIVVEYSKSINIPVSQTNNKILGLSYRLDREIVNSSTTNLGLYLDPNKRIPMKLVYNNEVVLDGYAKFVSSTSSQKDNYYTLNLFGILGDIFYKLKNIVLTPDKLTDEQKSEPDGGAKYILNDHSIFNGERVSYNAHFVGNSWYDDDIDLSETFPTSPNFLHKVYGATPSYCGFYPNFEPDKVQLNSTTSASISDCLSDVWRSKYCNNMGWDINNLTDAQQTTLDEFIDSLDPDGVVGDGLRDYEMKDYRSHLQRPFIYFNKLMYMFKEKIQEISDYTLELDSSWFNSNNPYWAKMCYVFDILEKEGQSSSTARITDTLIIPATDPYDTNGWAAVDGFLHTSFSNSSTDNVLTIEPSTLLIDLKLNTDISERYHSEKVFIDTVPGTIFEISITAGRSTQKYYASECSYEALNYFLPDNIAKPDEEHFITIYPMPTNSGVEGNFKNNPYVDELCLSVNLPKMSFEGDFTNSKNIAISITAINKQISTPTSTSFFEVSTKNSNGYKTISVGDYGGDFDGVLTFAISPLNATISWSNLPVGLDTFYKKEDPIFNIILEYTKMFGLYWDIDYTTKTLKLMRRETLFKDYTVEDWNDKLDRTQNMTIEPIAFPSKYILFNYEDVDGYRYSAYKEEYDTTYGNREVATVYEFNSDDTELFTNIPPCMVSNRNYVTYKRWIEWDMESIIKAIPDVIPRIECADEDNASPIQAGRWCMRSSNTNTEAVYITNETPLMIEEGKSYYIDYRTMMGGGIDSDFYTTSYTLPVLSPIYKDGNTFFSTFNTYYSCLFNTPYVDYTSEGLYKKAQGNTVYDICWSKFINERYNTQNKKVTAYFNLSVLDYANFKFNKLITVGNQLFMVNKINNFQPTQQRSTQCELIQIYDIEGYITPYTTFNPIEYSLVNLSMKDGRYIINTSNDYGTFHLYVRSADEINMSVNSNAQTDDYVYAEDVEMMSDNTTLYVFTYELVSPTYEFEITLKTDKNTTIIPLKVIKS